MKIRSLVVVTCFILLAFFLGYLVPKHLPFTLTRKDVPATNVNCPYKYINQLRCEPDIRPKKEYVALRNDIMAYIQKEKTAGHVSHVSVYFRDLQNGPTLSIDAQENFSPASLLKVPLMIMYFKKAETDPGLLSRKISITGELESLKQNIEPERRITPGQEYTIDELINFLVTQSDNSSWKALLNYLRLNYSEQDFIDTLSDLGIIDPRKDADMQYVTVQSYASIFRIFYNSSYLNREMSDKALKLLIGSAFNAGLEAGVPSDIQVAHKFGEQLNAQTNEQQLHDCGIVYYEPNPYIICVMTKGEKISHLERIISDVSQKIYGEIVSRS